MLHNTIDWVTQYFQIDLTKAVVNTTAELHST